MNTQTSSFAQYLAEAAPDMLPGRRTLPPDADTDSIPHGTTIIAAAYDGGVVMAGDRRATAGNLIAVRDVEKVFPADEYAAVGYAGAAGIGHELVKLYQVELEHYEKLEGAALSVNGKANRLSMLVRTNLGMAMQGLVVVPLLAAYDLDESRGRIFSYEPTGGRYEERNFHAVGSGSVFARGALKKLYDPESDVDTAITACLQALYDAAEDDSATGGPDVMRKIYPLVATVTDSGYHRVDDDDIARLVDRMLTGRRRRPDGPQAPTLGVDDDQAGRGGQNEGSESR